MFNSLDVYDFWGTIVGIMSFAILVILYIKFDSIVNYFKFEEKKDEPD